ncbi:MAG: TIGR02680 family protein [Chthoniobacter sp.]
MTPLPIAKTSRFQPLRSGLLNLFKYQDQEFWFEKGRLLVRGNNGAGKSRVLALQLPFLFDGEISSRRVEPDGDSARQMAWHLLMDDQFENRTGYTWIEFGRLDEHGVEHYVTLGCGLKAVKGGDNQPSRWYFITSKRIGTDFALQDGSTPRSADRLHEALSGEDFFTKTAREYRAEVNRRLFGLSGTAYAALIELLIRLRAPQLSKKLDEKTLFSALSDALPPLAADVVEQVANAFKQLEDLRLQYQTLRDLQESLQQFRSGYQAYMRTLLLRRADELTSRHSRYEKAHSNVTNLQQTIEAGEGRKAEAAARVTTAQNYLSGCEAAHSALQARPEANLAKDLDDAESRAREKAELFAAAQDRLSTAAAYLAMRNAEVESQSSATQQSKSERRQHEVAALSKVAVTGFAAEHAQTVPVDEDWPADAESLRTLQQAHAQQSKDHLHRLDQIEAAQTKLIQAEEKLTTAQNRQNQAFEKMEATREQILQHQQAAQTAVDSFATAYRDWRASLRWIVMPPWSEHAATFADWLETDVTEHRVFAGLLSAAVHREAEAQANTHAALQTRKTTAEHALTVLDDEAANLAETAPIPLLPKVRSAALESRVTRPGAPLWRLCDFQPHVNDQQRTGLEVALEAAGLLDAWITPDGRVSTVGMPMDTFLRLDTAAVQGLTLADALCRDAQSDAVASSVLADVLRQIGVGEGNGSYWVSFDGGWQLGPLCGHGEKTTSEFLGSRSREAARQRRLQEIAADRDRLTHELELIETELAQLSGRKAESAAEIAAVPKDEEIVRHLTLRTHARKLLSEATAHFDETVQVAEAARKTATDQRTTFESLIRHLGYGDHSQRIDELRGAWNDYDRAMIELWAKAQACATAIDHLERVESALRQAAETHARESETFEKAETTVIEARHSFEALQSSVGLSVSEFQAMLSQAAQAKEDAKTKFTAANDELRSIEQQLIGLEHELPAAEERLKEVERSREDGIRALRIIFDAGLFAEADERLVDTEAQTWAPTRATSIARIIIKTLPDMERDDAAWMRCLNTLDARISELRTSNGSACPVETQQLGEGLTLITCVYQNIRRRPAECLLAVERERETHDRLLAEEERKIIDRHLVTEVSLQLQQLIEHAQERTTKINKEMSRCATTLGVAMKLVWEPRTEDQPSALSAVRKLLLMDHAIWTDEQRLTVGNFLHQLIKDERIKNPTASSAEQLLNALDYRRWHAFSAERQQNGRWERLTRKRYGTGSGGEKALMLTIPQMAAAASHYSSAASHAPRFILLDEAFAGLDKPTRGRCMGLLEAFDLDLMMTSEREHGAHASVSGIAIYQLVADPDAVAATRWVWNGSQNLLAPVPDTPELRLV